MPTDHLFKPSDLESLENNPLLGKYKILVVGTFNGAIDGNAATWFYGRPENEFWCLFPRMLGFPTLHPVDRDETIEELTAKWKQFCKVNGIIIVDLFKTILVDIPNHADKNLEVLNPNQVIPFDFKKAFNNCTFEKVLFTWKGQNKNLLTNFKNQYIQFFEKKGSEMGHLLTPSNAYSKSRYFKLNSWREVYNNL
jgi:G:T/U-mismatch repair DNA glycosylase